MATFIGIVSASSSSSMFRNMKKDLRKNRNQRLFEVNCVSTFSDPYTTLRIHKGASESQVKKAFRQLALQYHPDVCRENNCEVQFYKINEAYDAVMSSLREEEEEEVIPSADEQGMYDPDYDMWEEWMGWEGAGTRNYTSHINPYI